MENTQTILKRTLKRQFDEMQTQPFSKLLLSVAYSSKLIDEYMKQPHDLKMKQQYYLMFESLYVQLQFKANEETSHQYFLQKGKGRTIMNEIITIISKYSEIKQKQKPISLILQTNNPTLVLQQVKNQLKLANKFYQQHKIVEAFRQVQMVKQVISRNQYIQQKIKDNQPLHIDKIVEDFNQLKEFQLYFEDVENWSKLKDQQETSTSKSQYKLFQNKNESESSIAVRMESQLDIEIVALLTALLEPQALQRYIPFIHKCQNFNHHHTHSSLPANAKILRSRIIIPYLIENYDLDFYSIIYDQLSISHSFFIFGQSLNQDKRFRERYQILNKFQNERMSLCYFCIQVKPITKQRVMLRVLLRPHFKRERFDYLTIKRAAKILNSHYFHNICKFIKENSKLIEQIQRSNQPFYGLLESKMDSYWKQKES